MCPSLVTKEWKFYWENCLNVIIFLLTLKNMNSYSRVKLTYEKSWGMVHILVGNHSQTDIFVVSSCFYHKITHFTWHIRQPFSDCARNYSYMSASIYFSEKKKKTSNSISLFYKWDIIQSIIHFSWILHVESCSYSWHRNGSVRRWSWVQLLDFEEFLKNSKFPWNGPVSRCFFCFFKILDPFRSWGW